MLYGACAIQQWRTYGLPGIPIPAADPDHEQLPRLVACDVGSHASWQDFDAAAAQAVAAAGRGPSEHNDAVAWLTESALTDNVAVAGCRESLRNGPDKLAATTTDHEQIPTIPDPSDLWSLRGMYPDPEQVRARWHRRTQRRSPACFTENAEMGERRARWPAAAHSRTEGQRRRGCQSQEGQPRHETSIAERGGSPSACPRTAA
ncbi:hypothetical protein AB0283_02660 [Micromonospora vinacea]|uniref:hypothetical protein n=1 Tax=Micromonospora vinacea TaxID=709878 RepID=UPI00344C63F4